MYGAFIILPKAGMPYPFHPPDLEVAILLGQWWKSNVDVVLQEALKSGDVANASDALTINGMPGQLYQCSQEDIFILKVDPHKTYLLRIVNAALNNDLFFGIAGHDLTVVAVDATYVKPFLTDYIVITPGQTTDVLITTDQPTDSYYMGAYAYVSALVPIYNSTTTAILRYKDAPFFQPPSMPILPTFTDTDSVIKFSSQLRSSYPNEYPALPMIVEKQLFITIGLAIEDCPKGALPQTCHAGLRNGRFAASMNNISFIKPDIAILEAFYYHTQGIYSSDFPQKPNFVFNYTGPPPNNTNSMFGTRVAMIPFGTNVQIILQGTSSVTPESHPIHLHGYDFYVVGKGFGNFDSLKKSSFNLLDPPKRNTIGVPVNGWAAIRFKADNPGAWFIHCHLDLHTVWGLDSVLIVENGNGPMQSMQPPPVDLPKC